jgi:hypothetical protein
MLRRDYPGLTLRDEILGLGEQNHAVLWLDRAGEEIEAAKAHHAGPEVRYETKRMQRQPRIHAIGEG